MAISCLAKINSNDKVNNWSEAKSNNGVARSAAHAKFSSVILATFRPAKIKSSQLVRYDYEANSNNGVERSAAPAQFSTVKMAISRSAESLPQRSILTIKSTVIT